MELPEDFKSTTLADFLAQSDKLDLSAKTVKKSST